MTWLEPLFHLVPLPCPEGWACPHSPAWDSPPPSPPGLSRGCLSVYSSVSPSRPRPPDHCSRCLVHTFIFIQWARIFFGAGIVSKLLTEKSRK